MNSEFSNLAISIVSNVSDMTMFKAKKIVNFLNENNLLNVEELNKFIALSSNGKTADSESVN